MKSKPSPLMAFLFAHRSEKLVTCVFMGCLPGPQKAPPVRSPSLCLPYP